mmetsp:Transcript_38058/g.113089  ORF Transcript_38058/g.113089 Transcript_38058/m.113089 type:complete len:235 (+) Transcript_38058:850-1554(+)
MTSCPSASGGRSAMFSAMVLPVTVMQSPCSKPSCSMYFSTAGVPPTACRSSITYLPLGLRFAKKGVSAAIRRKSCSVRSTPAARAIAMRWMVAFVDPPVTITSRTAFSKACFVMISRGLRPTAMQCCSASTALRTSDTFSGCSPPFPPLAAGSQAGMEDEYGTDMPSVSIADAMVLAVYIPPHAPGPGQACRTTSSRVSSSIFSVTNSPYAWKAEMMSSFSSLSGRQPARMVPP